MSRETVEAALAAIIDPETGHDLIAMGLIYGIEVESGSAHVLITTTVRGCPMAELLRAGAEAVVAGVPGIEAARVELTWDPPWTPDRMRL